jgi:hypothetical protein
MKSSPSQPASTRTGSETLEPFAVTRKQLFQLFSSPRMVQRMMAAGWIARVRNGRSGRAALFDYSSAVAAYERFKRGEEPPLLPCEVKRKAP